MSNLKFFNKVKSLLNIKAGDKMLIGKLSNSANNPNVGFIDVYFEVVNGVVRLPDFFEYIESENPKKAQVFVRGGYESYEKNYGYDQFILFSAHKSNQPVDEGACIFTCVYNFAKTTQHLKLNKHCPFIAEISQTEFTFEDVVDLKSAHTIDGFEKDFKDTPHFFQIDTDAKKLLGPLFSNEMDDSIFHGSRNEIRYEFWNSRSMSDYQSFLSTYDGYDENIVELIVNGVKRRFLINLDKFYIGGNNKPRNQDFSLIDLIPDSFLINEFYKSVDKVPAVKQKLAQKSKVREWLDNKSIKISKTRKSRLFKILCQYEEHQDIITDVFKKILDSELAEPVLVDIAKKDEDRYLDRYRQKENEKIELLKEEILSKREEIEQQNDAVKNELAITQKELVAMNKNKNDLQEEIDKKLKIASENIEKSEDYQNLLAEKNDELLTINAKIKESFEIYGNYEDLINLQEKYNKLNKEVEFKIMRERELADGIKKLQEQAKLSSSDLARAYMNQQVISDIQNHDHYKYLENRPAGLDEEKKFFVKVENNSEFMSDNRNANRKEVISTIVHRLEKMNRSVERDKVEAAFVAIMQNQYTVFLGLPGSGKTSFAVQLGCALGAANETLKIPVAKDWTRPKDLMGYHNPITNTYEHGVTGFYQFYYSLNQYLEEEMANSFLILDEFNLSQPEFYLSSLTDIADNNGSRKINLGHNKFLTIPKTSRFLCTANTDETVQSLSPRMISRCAFVQFNDLPELDQAIDDLSFNIDFPPLLTGSEMIDLFSASSSDIISDPLKKEIDKLVLAFRETNDQYGNGISITPRKYKQLLEFCKVMNLQDYGQSMVLDYASTFFLLPLITGSGGLFKSRLLNIKSIAEDFSLDEFVMHIDKLIVEGEENFEQFRFIMS